MRDLSIDNITDVVCNSVANTDDPRLKEILQAFIRKAHELVQELELTHEEWEKAVQFLLDTGKISSDQRNEFILLSDILGITSLVDILASEKAPGASERSVLGPFYIPNAPVLEFGGDLIKNNEGPRMVVQGRVISTDGKPLAGALVDVWQNAANGLYSNMDPNQHDNNLRCRTYTSANGEYCYSSVIPVAYQVPDDGTGGVYMKATGRHCWRPAHIHARVCAEGHEELVTEIFNSLDKYIDEDATFGVRTSLALPFNREPTEDEKRRFSHIEKPFHMVDFDFVLKPVKKRP